MFTGIVETTGVIEDLNYDNENLNLTIGNFDGVHIGHQKIIHELINLSKKKKYKSAILSFNPHPRKYFKKI